MKRIKESKENMHTDVKAKRVNKQYHMEARLGGFK